MEHQSSNQAVTEIFINPLHIPTIYFEYMFDIILLGLPTTPLRFPNQNFVYTSYLPHACYMPYPLILLDINFPCQHCMAHTQTVDEED